LATIAAVCSATYNPAAGAKALHYAKVSYCSTSDIENWKCGAICSKIQGVESASKVEDFWMGTFGYVTYNSQDNMIVASFRGSTTIINWINNINFFKSNYKGLSKKIQVHTGFLESYMSVADQVVERVSALVKKYPSASILFTGHSLGGAMATFAAMDVKEKLGLSNFMMLYTFGSPRTGNKAWADYVMKLYAPSTNLFRIVHGKDMVPYLPQRLLDFTHVGTEIWYPRSDLSSTYKTCENGSGLAENSDCSYTLGITDVSVLDHMIYVDIDFRDKWCTNGSIFNDPIFRDDDMFLK
jgi:predicted lipase